jgi:hypothetical protein
MTPEQATAIVRDMLDRPMLRAANFMLKESAPAYLRCGQEQIGGKAFVLLLLVGDGDEIKPLGKALEKIQAYHQTDPRDRPLFVPHAPAEFGNMEPSDVVIEWNKGCTNTIGKDPGACPDCTTAAMRAIADWCRNKAV